jgi:hypothetical protein
MNGIAIYVEGGGDYTHHKADLRRGFDALLRTQKDSARLRSLRWKLVSCGGRNAAYDAFINALRLSDADTANVLLVDSEDGLPSETADMSRNAQERVAHLSRRDGWDLTASVPESIHLMVRCMEAWIVSDADALAQFYGKGFVRKALPTRLNLEDEPKPDIYNKLVRATRHTQKGEYGKIKHASQLLSRIDPDKIIHRCPRFATFTGWLGLKIAGA